MKKLFLTMLLVVFLFASVTPVVAMRDTWVHDHNDSGLSECAIQVIKKVVLTDEYDWIVARFNPLTSIGGSGCTVDAGTTSFSTASNAFWYVGGGVTLNPQQFKVNKVLTYWFSEETDSGTEGTSGTSPYFKYQWVSNAGSGNTDWKVKVLYETSDVWTEILTTSGASIYASGPPQFPRSEGTALVSGNTVTSSTTFYPSYYVGWNSGVTPIINVIGKK